MLYIFERCDEIAGMKREAACQRHDLSNERWKELEPHLTGQQGQWGGLAKDNRQFINGVLWVVRTGAPWWDLPTAYGKWNRVFRRFLRWRDAGRWESLLKLLMESPDSPWLMIDASQVKVHPHAAGAKGGNQASGLTKGGATPKYLWPWLRLVCRCELLLQRVPWLLAHKLRL
jgi:transposase